MDRRLFILAGLAGLTDPVTPIVGAVTAPAPDPVSQTGDAGFDAWSADFLARAIAAGWPEALVRAELQGLTPDQQVLANDHRQPEFSRPIGDYIHAAVSEKRVTEGHARKAELEPWLRIIHAKFSVDPAVLVAIWGIESSYGAIQGDFDVVRSLATLAADGRRRGWAEGELFDCLKIIQTHAALRQQLKGSWAGAMGQTQIEPSVFLSHGVDIDGDGRVNIWDSAPDALGSTANILKDAGWTPGQDWAREVRLAPSFDYALAEGPKNPPEWWAAQGATLADGKGWAAADAGAPAQLLLPAGAAGPAFLALPNHFTIRAYNNSMSYALAVGLIADALAGGAPVQASWPQEAPLSVQDRTGAQTALKTLGFYAGEADGRIGPQTRAALRLWQKAKALPADGHLTVDLSRQLQTEAMGR
jgi:membrane-bound lytic murein transglycosylase B